MKIRIKFVLSLFVVLWVTAFVCPYIANAELMIYSNKINNSQAAILMIERGQNIYLTRNYEKGVKSMEVIQLVENGKVVGDIQDITVTETLQMAMRITKLTIESFTELYGPNPNWDELSRIECFLLIDNDQFSLEFWPYAETWYKGENYYGK